MLKTLIFDLDGLLSDTETLHMTSFIEALNQFSIPITEEEYSEHWIRKGLGIDTFLKAKNIQCDLAELRQCKVGIYHRLLDESLDFMPHAKDILDYFLGRTPMALATSSYRRDAEKVLKNLDIDHYFSVFITGDDVKTKKPAPDMFIEAAAQLNVFCADCIVLEDAEKGIIAARDAGMYSIAVPNRFTVKNDFSHATRVCESLQEAIEIIHQLSA